MKKYWVICVLLASIISCQNSFAIKYARPLATDRRIKVVNYQKDNVVPIHATPFTATQIVFGKDEVIENIQNGDLAAWTLSVQKGLGHMLFIKPTILGSNTNMTVVTSRHTYYFHLMSQKNESKTLKNVTYAIHFRYPEQTRAKMQANLRYNRAQKHAVLNAHKNPADYNWDYYFSGARSIMPLHIFDDGRFTYLQLKPNRAIPAIFAVDNEQGKESVVNYRREGRYLVISQIAPQFTLRIGKTQVASVFNQKLIKRLKNEA